MKKNSVRYAEIKKTRRGDYLVRWFGRDVGRAETSGGAQKILNEVRGTWLMERRGEQRRRREMDRLEKSCTTPIRYSRQVTMQVALRDFYQRMRSTQKIAADTERFHGLSDDPRRIAQVAYIVECAETEEAIYERAAAAHHQAAVARRAGDGDGWDRALAVAEKILLQVA